MSTVHVPAPAAGVYVHVPFCSAICPYCDFAVKKLGPRAGTKIPAYLEALLRELAALQEGLGPPALREPLATLFASPFDSLYLGGGTPSLLPPDALATLFAALRAALAWTPDTRLHFEVNPEDVDPTRLASWRELGVHTVSLGIQSFDDDELRFLGRRHDATTATRAVEQAQEAGFTTVSVDLIYGLPGQSRAAWERGLRRAIALAPDHLSLYELEIHPRTSFGKAHTQGRLLPLGDEDQAELFLFTHELLAAEGYQAYEVSNFARAPEHRSRHNQKYWRHVPYLGLGPAAHSYCGRHRWWQERHEPRWRQQLTTAGHGIQGYEQLTKADLVLEALMLGLRTPEGVDLGALENLHQLPLLLPNQKHLHAWQTAGLVTLTGTHLRPTPRGLAVADRLAAEFELPLSPAPA